MLLEVPLADPRVRLRAYRSDDAARLADIANDPAIPRWMTARFPHPYSFAAAQEWVGRAAAEFPIDNFVIEVDGELAGGIGITPQSGEIAGVAEFGYWLGRAFWGQGIATQAAAVVVAYAFGERGLRRLEAHVFAPNLASIRVLEKNGFRREAILRERYVERDGGIVDGLLYARLRSES